MVVVIFHDHGSRYLGKMYNDEWMRSRGFFEVMGMTARDLVAMGGAGELFAGRGGAAGRRGCEADEPRTTSRRSPSPRTAASSAR